MKPTASARRPSPSSDSGWSAGRRGVVSVLLVWHLLAIVVAPWTAVEPRSQLGLAARRVFEPYVQFMYLDHGYRFFAPEPGPSHLVRYEMTDADGQTSVHHFPDRHAHWPRLRYHRWFMLSETIHQHASLILDEEAQKRWQSEIDEQAKQFEAEGHMRRAAQVRRDYQRQLADYQQVERMLERLRQDLGHYLIQQHDGRAVNMTLLTRLIPTPFDVLDGYQLADDVFLPGELQFDLGMVGQGGREALPVDIPDEGTAN